MNTTLVTGGTGLLGRAVVDRLAGAGHSVHVLTRRSVEPVARDARNEVRYVSGDLRDGAGLDEALDGVDTVVHCASDVTHAGATDVAGTARLVDAMRTAGAQHLVYVSIVGVDRIPISYYKAKLATEGLIENSTVSWTIQRATQFHQLLDALLRKLSRTPMLIIPNALRFQPVDPDDLAARLVAHVAGGPAGRAPDFGGPEVHTAAYLARTWMAAHGRRRLIAPAPLPGKLGRALKDGANLCPDHADGQWTWDQFLRFGGRITAGEHPATRPADADQQDRGRRG